MFYKSFTITGVINISTLDGGLFSLVAEPVRVRAVLINSSATEGNIIECWIGTKRVMACYDYLFDTQEETAGATAPLSQNKISRLPIELDVPPGQAFKIGINCGGTASDLYGAYEYDVIS